jgi:hypothetical protein
VYLEKLSARLVAFFDHNTGKSQIDTPKRTRHSGRATADDQDVVIVPRAYLHAYFSGQAVCNFLSKH